ncbi:MAG: RnfABCDGE type electron transport complex subunit B [Gammaproteobacteria bacterium]|nr:MAG: RnfABCDGE type electron transport complex subunit B [Gammaproteobacteria bacterium]
MNELLIEAIDALLPQTQCGKCGFSGCRPYAQAIAEGRADINQCSPGDQEGIDKLAQLLGVPPKPLNTAHGSPRSAMMVARIDEELCIGCTFCSRVCPVDAIVGTGKQMHTVIAAECTGCELCIAPCPMDCISLVPTGEKKGDDKKQMADNARTRHQFRLLRLEREKQAGKAGSKHKPVVQAEKSLTSADERKKAIVQAAIQRAAIARTHPYSPVKPHERS